jgi:hypothetical protein
MMHRNQILAFFTKLGKYSKGYVHLTGKAASRLVSALEWASQMAMDHRFLRHVPRGVKSGQLSLGRFV